jgi:hypothetical protein
LKSAVHALTNRPISATVSPRLERWEQAVAAPDGKDQPTVDEVRTRRLTVVDEDGSERAIIQISHGHIELRLLTEDEVNRCELLAFAGEQVPGILAAGIELWINGNSVSGFSAIVTGKEIECHRFP